MGIEEIVSGLQNLVSKSILSKSEHESARQLMRQLKLEGMSNEEISRVSYERWTPSTIKGYCTGIKASNPSRWHDAISLLDEMIKTGMSLDNIQTALSIFKEMESHGVNLEDMISLLTTIDSTSITMDIIIRQHKDLKQSGLSPKDVSDALNLKKELEERGLTLNSFKQVVELAKNLGDPQQIIHAMTKHASLTELEKKIALAGKELDYLNQQTRDKNDQLSNLNSQLDQLKNPLNAYEKVLKLGFNQNTLVKLASQAKKYGGVKEILGAIEALVSYSEILDKNAKAKAKFHEIQASIHKLGAQYDHLKTATSMCNTLIQKYNFGLDAIATILSIAKKHGEPLAVLKSIEAYGELKCIKKQSDEVQGKLNENIELLSQVQGRYKEAMSQLEMLNATALKVGEEVGKVENKLESSKDVEKLIDLIQDPASADYASYGPIVLVITDTIRKWLSTNQNRFISYYTIKSGVDALFKELGASS